MTTKNTYTRLLNNSHRFPMTVGSYIETSNVKYSSFLISAKQLKEETVSMTFIHSTDPKKVRTFSFYESAGYYYHPM